MHALGYRILVTVLLPGTVLSAVAWLLLERFASPRATATVTIGVAGRRVVPPHFRQYQLLKLTTIRIIKSGSVLLLTFLCRMLLTRCEMYGGSVYPSMRET